MSKPEIIELKWGQIVVAMDNTNKIYKDCRIWNNGSSSWDWSKTGTRHKPGIQFADLADLLCQYPDTEIIIFSSGMDKQLDIHPDTMKLVTEKYPKVTIYRDDTKAAVKLYGELRKKHTIIALLHSTC